ncbi:MAG: hypothetical protein ABIT83_01545 [Massilia sp.]
MKIHQSILAGFIACLFATGAAHAEVGVTVGLGTTGLGAHLSIPVQPNLNTRVGINAAHYNFADKSGSVDYDYKFKLQTVDVLADWFPMDGGFRVTGGLVYNGNKFEAHGKPAAGGGYEVNGTNYASGAGSINGGIEFRKAAPYLGIGWGNAVAKDSGWGFSSDLGVLFQGSPKNTLTNTGCTLTSAVCAKLATDLAAERKNFDDDSSSFKYYPVLRVGASYKF